MMKNTNADVLAILMFFIKFTCFALYSVYTAASIVRH